MTAKIDVPQQDPVVGVAHVVTDEVVVQRKRTFDAFYQDSYRTVLRLVWAMAGSHAAAEDLTQDAFVVASRRWAEVSSLDDPLGWVKRVALNRASSAFIGARPKPEHYSDPAHRQRPHNQPCPPSPSMYG